MTGALRGDHDDVDTLRRLDVAEADVEAVTEQDGLARCEVRLDVGLVDDSLVLVGRENDDDVGPLGSLGDGKDFEAGLLSLRLGLRVRLQRDDNLDA